MTVAVCIENRGGLLFLNRRVSRDRAILADLAAFPKERLLAHPFSLSYLEGAGLTVLAMPDFLDKAQKGDLCFLENQPLAPHLERVKRLLVYRFGEAYPFDFSFDLFPRLSALSLTERTEFAGFAHKTITREIYSL